MAVKDYNLCLKTLKLRGIDVIQSGNYLGRTEYSYLSTDTNIGCITEIYNGEELINIP
jgi:hypothetical protein